MTLLQRHQRVKHTDPSMPRPNRAWCTRPSFFWLPALPLTVPFAASCVARVLPVRGVGTGMAGEMAFKLGSIGSSAPVQYTCLAFVRCQDSSTLTPTECSLPCGYSTLLGLCDDNGMYAEGMVRRRRGMTVAGACLPLSLLLPLQRQQRNSLSQPTILPCPIDHRGV
jgi:hypothetical protein